jgi:hypothetical protein
VAGSSASAAPAVAAALGAAAGKGVATGGAALAVTGGAMAADAWVETGAGLDACDPRKAKTAPAPMPSATTAVSARGKARERGTWVVADTPD